MDKDEAFGVYKIVGIGYGKMEDEILTQNYDPIDAPDVYIKVIWELSKTKDYGEYSRWCMKYTDDVESTYVDDTGYFIIWKSSIIPVSNIISGDTDNNIYKKLSVLLKNENYKKDRSSHPLLREIYRKFKDYC